MDVRDVFFWAREARQRAWSRRVEAYNAALLPHQKADVVKQTMESLRVQGLEFAYGDKVDDTEQENAKRMAEVAERRKARRAAKKSKLMRKKKGSKIRRIG